MNKLLASTALMLGALTCVASAGPSGTIQYSVAVCDPNSPFRCVAPDASGNMPVTLSGSPIVAAYAKATAAAPTYVEGTNNPFSVDLSGNLRTSVLSALPAGTNAIGYVGGFNAIVTNAPTVSNAAYTANYSIGGLQTVSAFRNTTQPSGLLSWVQVSSKGGYNTTITIYGFTAARNTGALFSTCTNNAAFVLNNSDLPYLIPGFPITVTPAALNSTTQTIGSAQFTPPVSVKNADSVVSQNLYFCAVANSTTTPASTSDLTFYYSFLQD